MPPRYRDEQWLRNRYWEDGLTQREIAEECGVSPRTIRKYMTRFGIETRDMEGETHPLYGCERDEETKAKISESLTGREFSDEARERMANSHRGEELPAETRQKIAESLRGTSKSPATREQMSRSRTGEDNPNWRGGYSRAYGEGWTRARRQVRNRDQVCQRCGHDGSERTLDVHHIVPVREFREDPEATLREAHRLDNLVLLCRSCHAKVEHGKVELDARPDADE